MTGPAPAGTLVADPEHGLDGLRDVLRSLGEVVVAFSGGADSAFLAWVATTPSGPPGCGA